MGGGWARQKDRDPPRIIQPADRTCARGHTPRTGCPPGVNFVHFREAPPPTTIPPCAMTHADQKKMIAELAYYSRKMKRDDYEVFEILQQRDKDDEDLDTQSMKKLKELFTKYVPHAEGWL